MGRYLLNEFKRKDHDITLVEYSASKCEKIEERFEVETVQGDGAEPEVLKEAGVETADVLLAVTKDDQDNLVICQLAERQFDVPRTFTTVNTPGNERLFDWLGVNVAVSSASVLAALVEQEVKMQDLKGLLSQNHEELKLCRVSVEEGSKAEDKALKDLELPMEVVLVSILRGDTPLVPRGNTKIFNGDIIMYLSREKLVEEVEDVFTCRKN